MATSSLLAMFVPGKRRGEGGREREGEREREGGRDGDRERRGIIVLHTHTLSIKHDRQES